MFLRELEQPGMNEIVQSSKRYRKDSDTVPVLNNNNNNKCYLYTGLRSVTCVQQCLHSLLFKTIQVMYAQVEERLMI